jgi:protein SCO1/2
VPERLLAATLVVLALVLSACGGSAAPATFYGVTHDAYTVLPDPLTDTEGKPFSLVDDTAKPLTLVFFGYTHCPDICGQVMNALASAMTRLSDDERSEVQVIFISTDPSRDTPTVLRHYLDHYNPAFEGLTGDLDTIAAIGKPLAVYVAQGQKLASGGYDLNTHSTQVAAITPDDKSTVLWTMDTSSAQFASDIRSLLKQSS